MKNCSQILTLETKPENIKEEEWKMQEIKAKNYIVNSITNTQLELIINAKGRQKK